MRIKVLYIIVAFLAFFSGANAFATDYASLGFEQQLNEDFKYSLWIPGGFEFEDDTASKYGELAEEEEELECICSEDEPGLFCESCIKAELDDIAEALEAEANINKKIGCESFYTWESGIYEGLELIIGSSFGVEGIISIDFLESEMRTTFEDMDEVAFSMYKLSDDERIKVGCTEGLRVTTNKYLSDCFSESEDDQSYANYYSEYLYLLDGDLDYSVLVNFPISKTTNFEETAKLIMDSVRVGDNIYDIQ